MKGEAEEAYPYNLDHVGGNGGDCATVLIVEVDEVGLIRL